MMKLMFLIFLISANCIKMNCDEESITTETIHEVSEKTELLSADPESLENRTGSKESENEATNITEDNEEMHVSQSSTDRSLMNEPQFDLVSTKTHSTEVTFTDRSAPDDVLSEIEARTSDKEITRRDNSADTTQDNLKPLEIVEKQSEELPKMSTSTPEIEDKNAKDLLEASAESKLSDNEKTSSIKDETARNSETEEIKEKSDESDSITGLETRRMLIPPDIVIDTKMRADTTSSSVKSDMKTALNQNLNTYNLNEFAIDRNIKLINTSRTESSPIIETTPQSVNSKLASQEIFNQRYIPKLYPRSELNINFPNVNSDFQGPRDLPIYLRIKPDEPQVREEARLMQWSTNGLQPKPDEYQSENQSIGVQNPKFKSTKENIHFNPRNEQQHHQSQRMLDTSRTDINKHFDYLTVEKKSPAPYQNHVPTDFKTFSQNNQSPDVNQNFGSQAQQSYPNSMPQFYQNHLPTDFKSLRQNTKSPDLNQDSKNQVQALYENQEKAKFNYKDAGNISRDLKNQVHDNTKMPENNNYVSNQYPLFRQPQGMRINLENKQFGNEPFANPYSYPQRPRPQQINVINVPARYNIIPPNIKILFQKLASASLYPTQFNLFRNNNRQIYPLLNDSKYRPNFSFYGIRN